MVGCGLGTVRTERQPGRGKDQSGSRKAQLEACTVKAWLHMEPTSD